MGMEFFIDSKAGTVLGRTAMSWAKISLFYLVYYSLLGALSYISVTYYQNNQVRQVGGVPQANNKRLDQPGVVPHPHAHWLEDRNQEIDLSKKGEHYDEQMKTFLKMYDNSLGQKCLADGDTEKHTCSIANADYWNLEKVSQRRMAKKPVVFLTVNKVVGWKPLRAIKTAAEMGKRNQIGFNCTEIDGLDGKVVGTGKGETGEESNFIVRPVQNDDNVMNPYTFPFPGKNGNDLVRIYGTEKENKGVFIASEEYNNFEKNENNKLDGGHRYQSPFVAIEVVPKDDTTEGRKAAWGDEKMKFFRCKVIADNIETFNGKKDGFDENLRKMSTGFVEWGFGYSDYKDE